MYKYQTCIIKKKKKDKNKPKQNLKTVLRPTVTEQQRKALKGPTGQDTEHGTVPWPRSDEG